ncbi:MAG: NAD-dependent epimerase/dehydratase family protein [Candidatus Pacearchaeota archaeon]|nr:NAD-dependent epimerase/dehydratase family protein [Candidatus Pacearchaeota archaeon]
MDKKILVIGAMGQIGSELVLELRKIYGNENVVASGRSSKSPDESSKEKGPFEVIEALDKEQIRKVVEKYKINELYHLAAILSATGEKDPKTAWTINMDSLINVLDLAKEYNLRVFWPSSIAVFGPTTPKKAPQQTVLEPTTMYGITKVAGELLCSYYKDKFGVDVRGLRFPGIISYKTLPGGGTTDYAVEIFYECIKKKEYNCFVSCETTLPMMYMPDCIKSIIQLMQAPKENLKHVCYNVAGISFSAKELADEIKKSISCFKCSHEPDFRQKIADSWPNELDDSEARKDWNWKPDYDLKRMTADMLEKISEKLGKQG